MDYNFKHRSYIRSYKFPIKDAFIFIVGIIVFIFLLVLLEIYSEWKRPEYGFQEVKIETVKVYDLLANSDQYDGQLIKLKGVCEEVEYRISKKGNPYTICDLYDGTGTIRIFSFGRINVLSGSSVLVRGSI